jgi:hypothetical protein
LTLSTAPPPPAIVIAAPLLIAVPLIVAPPFVTTLDGRVSVFVAALYVPASPPAV